MKLHKFLENVAIVLLIGSLLAPTTMAGAGGAKKSRSQVVGTDPVGDWGENAQAGLGALGDLLGQDLVGASIVMDDPKTLNFIFELNSLPLVGGIPEFSRYLWELSVDGNWFLLDGKFTNYHRGSCDPTSGQCLPPRDPGLYPFIIIDGCAPGIYFNDCHEAGLVHASFDPSERTITVPVPLELIGAKPGSRIGPGVENVHVYGGSVTAGPSVWRTPGAFPRDALVVKRTFLVPRR